MKNSYYWFLKFDRLAGNCFENALRLHFDSIQLFHRDSFASALALSILAMEELAKAHLVEDIVWHARVDRTPIDFSWESIQNVFRSHRTKQMIFANHAFSPKIDFKKGRIVNNQFWKLAESSQLESLKQNALYVGLSGKCNQRTINPLLISRNKPKKNITIVNDYLINLVVGVIHETYIVDSEHIEAVIDKALLIRLTEDWPYRGQVGLKAMKFHKEDNTD